MHGITLGEIDSAGPAYLINHASPARRTAWDMPPDVVTTFNANIPQSIQHLHRYGPRRPRTMRPVHRHAATVIAPPTRARGAAVAAALCRAERSNREFPRHHLGHNDDGLTDDEWPAHCAPPRLIAAATAHERNRLRYRASPGRPAWSGPPSCHLLTCIAGRAGPRRVDRIQAANRTVHPRAVLARLQL